jgi:hypothetical protein
MLLWFGANPRVTQPQVFCTIFRPAELHDAATALDLIGNTASDDNGTSNQHFLPGAVLQEALGHFKVSGLQNELLNGFRFT